MLSRIVLLTVFGVGLASAQNPVQQRSASKSGAEWSKLKTEAPITNVRVQLRTGEALECRLDRVEMPFRGKYADEPRASHTFKIVDGIVAVPDGPGLGLTIDPAYLAKAQLVASA